MNDLFSNIAVRSDFLALIGPNLSNSELHY